MDTMKLFMAIPDRINFLQLGRYGRFSEQTYRNLFENETFDWFAFNASIISKHLTGKRKAIAIDPSYIPKSGHKTPWIGYFWSGCAGDYKRGLEIMGIGVIDIDPSWRVPWPREQQAFPLPWEPPRRALPSPQPQRASPRSWPLP